MSSHFKCRKSVNSKTDINEHKLRKAAEISHEMGYSYIDVLCMLTN